MKYRSKLRTYKFNNKLIYREIADALGVSLKAVKDWAGVGRPSHKKITYENAVKLCAFTNGYITMKDCGYNN